MRLGSPRTPSAHPRRRPRAALQAHRTRSGRLALGGALAALLAALLLAVVARPAPHGRRCRLRPRSASPSVSSPCISSSWRARKTARALQPGPMHELGERLERRLEQLQDVRWELNENESRYRALLDAQEHMISRRDASRPADVRQQGVPRHVRRHGRGGPRQAIPLPGERGRAAARRSRPPARSASSASPSTCIRRPARAGSSGRSNSRRPPTA